MCFIFVRSIGVYSHPVCLDNKIIIPIIIMTGRNFCSITLKISKIVKKYRHSGKKYNSQGFLMDQHGTCHVLQKINAEMERNQDDADQT